MTAYKLAVLEILRNLFELAYIASALSLHIESTDSMIGPKELKLAKLSLAMVEQLMPQDDKSTAMQIYSFLVCNGVD